MSLLKNEKSGEEAVIRQKTEYCEETGKYSFLCPFCGREIVLNEKESFCEHLVFAHDLGNSELIYIDSDWEDMCCELLVIFRNSIESFDEFLCENYYDEDDRDADSIREAAEEAVWGYINDGFFTVDDLVLLLKTRRRKRLLNASRIFECDDPCGMTTQYYLADIDVFRSYNRNEE